MRSSFVCKASLFFALAFSAATLVACGDDSSSSPKKDDSEEIESSDSEDESSSSVESTDDSSSSASNTSSSSEDSEESSSSTNSDEKKEESSSSTTVESSADTATSSSSENATSSSSKGDDQEHLDWNACTEEGAISYYLNSDRQSVAQVCHDGVWVDQEPVSSSSAESSIKHYDLEGLYNEDIEYGSFKDTRDGKTYKTIEIKGTSALEFFAENLNYGKQIKSTATSFDDEKVEKYCYNDDAWYCENGFGGLYSWSEAMGLPKACDSVKIGSTKCPFDLIDEIKHDEEWANVQVQGVCPAGWHLMNENEWMKLTGGTTYVGDLMTSVFGGENDYGFSALPGGMYSSIDPVDFELMPEYGYIWLPQEYNDIGAYAIIYSLSRWYSSDNERKKSNGMSVRCVKNYSAQ